jgi:hypothetical protein
MRYFHAGMEYVHYTEGHEVCKLPLQYCVIFLEELWLQ